MDIALKIFAVGAGGSVGAVIRYLINISPIGSSGTRLPLSTLLINISGSFLIGFLMMALATRFEANENLRLLLIVGFLGGFTTFSAFEMDLYDLVRTGSYISGFAYLFLSVFAGFVGVVAGVELGRRFQ